jgi:hypothetical protein
VRHLEELSELDLLAQDDFSHLLPGRAAADLIREAIRSEESAKLSPVFRALGGRYSFETIRLVRLSQS